ncbi:MAG TPA: AI-2E family transporter [Candidatus Limnocylindrales bacterium]|nr:AI-2E family transporter [Candidatus Limnocylindrales bacterium]
MDPDEGLTAGTDAASLVPRWVRGNTNLFAMLVAAVVAGVGIFLIAWLAPVLAPLGLGLFLAALAAPLFTWLEERGRSAALALTLTVALVLVIGAGLVVLAIVGARSLAEGLVGYSDALESRYPDLAGPTAANIIVAVLSRLLPPELLIDVLRAVSGFVLEVGQTLLFAVIVAALLLLDGQRLARLASGGLGSENPVFREAPAIARAAVTYFGVRIRVNIVTAAGLLLLMLVLGIDDALLWAVAAFFLSFVPYLGLILAMIPPTILAIAESGPLAAAVFVIGGTALNLIAENLLEPTLTGRALSLSTWLVFIMFFFWVWLLGPVGALLSMPITVLVVLVLQHNERTQWVAALLTRERGDEPDEAIATPPPAGALSNDRSGTTRE